MFFAFILSSCEFSQSDDFRDPSIISGRTVTLTESGSRRATAYELSNKLLFDEKYIFAAYVDYEDGEQIVTLAKINRRTFDIEKEVTIGDARDDHGGAAILQDLHGNIHAFYGAHNTPLIYKYNSDGSMLDRWSDEITLGSGLTYPSAVTFSNGDILVVARLGFNVLQDDPWSYKIYRISNGKQIFQTQLLVSRRHDEDFVNRYIHYFTQMVVGVDDTVHMATILHERSSDDPVKPDNGLGYGIGYFYSNDYGESWFDINDDPLSLPGEVEAYGLLEGVKDAKRATSDYRSVSIEIDPTANTPVIAYLKYHFDEHKWTTWIAKKNGSGWSKKKVAEGIYKLSLYISKKGIYYLLGERLSDEHLSVEDGWSNSETRISILRSTDGGESFSEQILPSSASGPHWFPSLPKRISPFDTTLPVGMYMSGSINGQTTVVVTEFE